MKKFLIYLFCLFIVLTAAGYAVLKTFDLNSYKDTIIKTVKEKTGRDLVIAGKMELNISFSPSLQLSDVKLSNPSWASSPYMLQIGQLDIGVSLLPLLRKKVEINHFLLDNSVTDLEINAEGQNNWTFAAVQPVQKETADAKAPEAEGTKKAPAALLKGLEIGSFELKNAKISFSDQKKNKNYAVDLIALKLKESGDKVRMTLQTTVQGQNIVAFGDMDALSGLFDDEKSFHVDLTVQGAGTDVNVKASVKDPIQIKEMQAEVTVHGMSLAQTASAAGIKVPNLGRFDVSVRVAGNLKELSVPAFNVSLGKEDAVLIKASGSVEKVMPLQNAAAQVTVNLVDLSKVDGLPQIALPQVYFSGKAFASGKKYQLSDISLKAAKSDISGSVSIDAGSKILVKAAFLSNLIDLSDLLRVKPNAKATVAAADNAQPVLPPQTAQKAPKKEKLFSSAPLPFDVLNKLDAVFSFKVQKLIASNSTDLGQVDLSATLKNGLFSLSDFKIADFLSAKASMNASSGKKADINADIKLKKLSLPLFLSKDGVTNGIADADVSVSGSGSSVAQIAGSLNGKILFTLDNAVFSGLSMLEIKPYLPEGVLQQDGTVAMQCLVVNVPVKNGIISSQQQIGMKAGVMRMQVNGGINLGTEKLDLSVLLGADKADVLSAVSNAFVLTGSLASPTMSLNTPQVMNKALSVGLAYIIGGKKAAQEQAGVSVTNEPCQVALKGGAPLPKSAAAPVQAQEAVQKEVQKGVIELDKKVDSFLKGVFGNASGQKP